MTIISCCCCDCRCCWWGVVEAGKCEKVDCVGNSCAEKVQITMEKILMMVLALVVVVVVVVEFILGGRGWY